VGGGWCVVGGVWWACLPAWAWPCKPFSALLMAAAKIYDLLLGEPSANRIAIGARQLGNNQICRRPQRKANTIGKQMTV